MDKTFQDLEIAIRENTVEKFVLDVIGSHSTSTLKDAEKYYRGENPFLSTFNKSLTLKDGKNSVEIDTKPAVSVMSGIFKGIVTHKVGRLLDNPVSVSIGGVAGGEKESPTQNVSDHLGDGFDTQVKQLATFASIHGVCYAFYNNGSIEVFKATEYVPLVDERTGAHKAGVRYWRVNVNKPYIVQLFTMDGYTEWRRADGGELTDKEEKSYTNYIPTGGAGFVATTKPRRGKAYSDYPIIPWYVNPFHESDLTAPIKGKIDAYDCKETAYIDEALKMKFIQWVFKGYGGDVRKLQSMLKTMRQVGFISGDHASDDTSIESKQMDIPYLSHANTQERIETNIYRDAQIMHPIMFRTGAVTATEIQAVMRQEDTMMNGMENEARKAIAALLKLAGVNFESITFSHKTIIDGLAQVQMLNTGVPDLPFEYRLKYNPAIPQEDLEQIVMRHEAEQIGIDDGLGDMEVETA